MSTEGKHYAELIAVAQRVLWSFGLNLPENPPGDGSSYVCPAEAYLELVEHAAHLLAAAQRLASDEIPETIQQRGRWLEHSHLSAVEEMATAEPEVRRLWAVRAAHDVAEQLYGALVDEARPSPRVVLPKLAKTRRTT